MSAHTLLSPSGSHLWSKCEAQLAMCRDIPNLPNEKSARGTACHTVSEECLKRGHDAKDFVGTIYHIDGFEILFNDDDAAWVQTYVDAILRASHGKKLCVEGSVDTSDVLLVPGQKGTLDVNILDFEKLTLEVHDLKSGEGMVHASELEQHGGVHPKRSPNPQLGIYALASLHKYAMLEDWRHVKLCIHMPRLDYYDEVLLSVSELLAWGSGVAHSARKAHELYTNAGADLRPFLKPGDHCTKHYCPVRGSCSARVEQLAAAFPVLEQQPVTQLPHVTSERLAELLERAEAIDALLDAISKEAFARQLAGNRVPGRKLVTGKKGDRKWKDLEQVAPRLSLVEGGMVPVSPAVAEKLMRKAPANWAELQKFITQEPGKPTLAKADDPRPEWTRENNVANAFAAIDSGNADGLI